MENEILASVFIIVSVGMLIWVCYEHRAEIPHSLIVIFIVGCVMAGFFIHKRMEEQESVKQAAKYIESGWTIYKDGEKVNSAGIDSINWEDYTISFNKENKIVSLKPE